MNRPMWLVAITSFLLLSGCVNLKSVRDFAADTKKVAAAYEPIGKAAEGTCIRSRTFKDENEWALSAREYDPDKVQTKAVEGCKTAADELKGTQRIADVLKAYADALSELAGDGLASRLTDDADVLFAQISQVPGVPAEKASAIKSLVAFVSRIAIAKAQAASIDEALAHEDAVGVLADALVLVAERHYLGGVSHDLVEQMDSTVSAARNARLEPLLVRMLITRISAERRKVVEQQAAVAQLKRAVNQMKVAMADVRANLHKLDNKARLESILQYRQEVNALYKTLANAF